ncbi:MAG: polysaccharide biosynthesis tyrosine autokinase [Muribaculum sp.]|nr:polysaccharide biosynthesis tyrosine autokinase [Muribaculaceae bacterium]MCM1080552.1 polysaccharide biosynthesis tyrosine autokinase [Muribaculum sp.]
MSTTDNVTQETDEQFNLREFMSLCILHWRWFVLSIGVCLILGSLYLLHKQPTYNRHATILIKEDSKKSGIGLELSAVADMGMFSPMSKAENELASIKSPALAKEVVKRLHLNMEYSTKSLLRTNSLYGTTLPVTVTMLEVDDNESAGFKLDINENDSTEIVLSDFARGGEDYDKSITAQLGDTVSTPIGLVIIDKSLYFDEAPKDKTIAVNHIPITLAIQAVGANLTGTQTKDGSSIIELDYTDTSIQRAEDVLNTLISVYNEDWVKDKNQIAVSTSRFINNRLAVIEQELGNVDSDISSYKSEHLIPDLTMATSMYMSKASEANSQLLDLNNQLYMARHIRNFIDSNHNDLLPANSGINSSGIEEQINTYNEMLLKRNSLASNSSEQNPLVQEYNRKLSAMRSAIATAMEAHISGLSAQIRSFQASEQQSTRQIASNPTQAKYLLSVERQQKVKEALYLFLLQKREENELSQAFTAYNTRIVTPPMGSMLPTAPNTNMVIFVSFMLGLIIPIAIIYISEASNNKIRGRKDLENVSIPFVGEIPLTGAAKKTNKLFAKKDKKQKKEVYNIVVKNGSRNVINEAYRVVRSNIEFMMGADQGSKVIMLTSINPGSGKTFTTLNLAASFALKGKKVVVIDLDMRRASLSSVCGSPSKGISGYLAGQISDWHTVVNPIPEHEGLYIVPVGTLPPNPSELLYSPLLKKMLDEMRQQYDMIFIDCPPTEIVADASIIAKLADMTIYIVRANLLQRDMLPVIERYYSEHKYTNMALLLNGTDSVKSRYGYHRYGYGYGYGYGNYGGYSKDE